MSLKLASRTETALAEMCIIPRWVLQLEVAVPKAVLRLTKCLVSTQQAATGAHSEKAAAPQARRPPAVCHHPPVHQGLTHPEVRTLCACASILDEDNLARRHADG